MKEYTHEYADFHYYTPAREMREIHVWPVRSGQNAAKPNYSVGPKRIESYSMHFVREGRLRLRTDAETFELAQGDLFCLFPGLSYWYAVADPQADPDLRLSWIVFDGEQAEALLRTLGCTPASPCRRGVLTPALERTIAELLQTMEANPYPAAAAHFELQSLLYRLFALLSPPEAAAEPRSKDGWLRHALDYMELHALEGISVEQTAAFVGLNRTYFSAAFQQRTGLSPKQHLQKLRLEKAKLHLQQDDATITEIAATLGYPSLYAFTRAFKRHYSLSPSEYRRRSRG